MKTSATTYQTTIPRLLETPTHACFASHQVNETDISEMHMQTTAKCSGNET